MRVLFVVSGSPEAASARYRCQHLAEALALASAPPQVEVVSAEASAPVRIGRGDIVVLHRLGMAGAGGRFLRAAHAVGATVVYSTDDLIFTSDFPHQVALLHPDDPVRYRQYRAAAADFRALLLAADAAIVSTEYLAERVRCAFAESERTPPVFVVRNLLSAEQVRLAEAALRASAPVPIPDGEAGVVTLAYLSGSPTHDVDLAGLADPLAVTLAHFPNARLLLVGPVTPPPSLRPAADRGQVQRHPFVPWRELPGVFSACHVDVCLAPLDIARPFSHAKSEVKFLEAAALGIPTVASPGAGFVEGVRAGQDCPVARTPEEWERCLRELIDDPEMRRRFGKAAQAAIQERGTIAGQAEGIREVFARIDALPRAAAERAGGEQVTVRAPMRERAAVVGRRWERRVMSAWMRWTRHLRLLREEIKGHGGRV